MQNTAGKRSATVVKEARKDYLKILRSADDHQRAMERMLSLMKRNPPLGSPESEEMEILGLLIEKYEDEHYPVTPPDPIEAIKFTMDQQGLKKKGFDSLYRFGVESDGSAQWLAEFEFEHDSAVE